MFSLSKFLIKKALFLQLWERKQDIMVKVKATRFDCYQRVIWPMDKMQLERTQVPKHRNASLLGWLTQLMPHQQHSRREEMGKRHKAQSELHISKDPPWSHKGSNALSAWAWSSTSSLYFVGVTHFGFTFSFFLCPPVLVQPHRWASQPLQYAGASQTIIDNLHLS